MSSLPTYQELAAFSENLENNRETLINTAKKYIEQDALSSVGITMTPDNARVIGYYVGAAPGTPVVGLENNLMVLMDQVTGEIGVFNYFGVTGGINLSVPGLGTFQGGVVLFNGSLRDVAGFSLGTQGSAGINVGYSSNVDPVDPENSFKYSMVQVGISASLAAEATFGYTWDMKDYIPRIDHSLTVRTLQNYFKNDKVALAEAMRYLADAQSFGGQDSIEFFEKYGEILKEGIRCFPAGTLITLADHTQKPIEDIRHGDIVLSHDKNGDLVPSVVDKLFTNTTDAFIRLSFDDRDDLIATPGHHFLTETGDYMEIGHMARLGGGQVRIVDTDGSIIIAKAERIIYSAETAEMFEQAAAKTIAYSGNTVLKEDHAQGWKTCDFWGRGTFDVCGGASRPTIQ